jgi:hypothetical protein
LSARGGDVLVAMGRSWGTGDEDIAAPALGLDRGGDVLVAMGDCRVPSVPDPLPRFRRAGIPEGWERIAPGRAKHAPGERRVMMDSAPRQGCEGCGFFNPCRGCCPFPREPGVRFATPYWLSADIPPG